MHSKVPGCLLCAIFLSPLHHKIMLLSFWMADHSSCKSSEFLILTTTAPTWYPMSNSLSIADISIILEIGFNVIMIHTVDTDVIVILVGKFYAIHKRYPSANIWVAFGTGKNFLETLGRINPILCPHFMPLLDVTVHICS